MNVEEIEIKQRSLASVKRSRLKDKRTDNSDDKKEIKKDINSNTHQNRKKIKTFKIILFF